MKIRLKTILAGPTMTGQPGDVLELDEKEAKPLLKGGYAEEVDSVSEPESKEAEKDTAQGHQDDAQS